MVLSVEGGGSFATSILNKRVEHFGHYSQVSWCAETGTFIDGGSGKSRVLILAGSRVAILLPPRASNQKEFR